MQHAMVSCLSSFPLGPMLAYFSFFLAQRLFTHTFLPIPYILWRVGLGDRIAVELDAGAHNVTGCPVGSLPVLWCPSPHHHFWGDVGEAPLRFAKVQAVEHLLQQRPPLLHHALVGHRLNRIFFSCFSTETDVELLLIFLLPGFDIGLLDDSICFVDSSLHALNDKQQTTHTKKKPSSLSFEGCTKDDYSLTPTWMRGSDRPKFSPLSFCSLVASFSFFSPFCGNNMYIVNNNNNNKRRIGAYTDLLRKDWSSSSWWQWIVGYLSIRYPRQFGRVRVRVRSFLPSVDPLLLLSC